MDEIGHRATLVAREWRLAPRAPRWQKGGRMSGPRTVAPGR